MRCCWDQGAFSLFVRKRITCRSWSHHCLDDDNQNLIEADTINNWTKVLPICPFISSKFILSFFFLLHNSLWISSLHLYRLFINGWCQEKVLGAHDFAEIALLPKIINYFYYLIRNKLSFYFLSLYLSLYILYIYIYIYI